MFIIIFIDNTLYFYKEKTISLSFYQKDITHFDLREFHPP